jgi:pyruvate ferredoxin oxidoreductase alpha subunit
MSVRDAGWIQLYCRDNQEILDTTLQAYRIAEQLHVPVMVCYDGFLLSHTVMPVELIAVETADEFLPPYTTPLTVVDPDDPRNIGPVTIADPRADADGVVRPGYMEIRQQLHATLLQALDVIPAVDSELGELTGRVWGGLTWEYLLDDAEMVLVAAGSLGMQLTVAVDQLRASGVKAGVLGIRAYRPFPAAALRDKLMGRKGVLVFDKAVSYGYEGPICTDVRAALFGEPGAPVVWGAVCGLGGRDVSPEQLADAALRALADGHDGIRHRPTDWVNLKLTGGAK